MQSFFDAMTPWERPDGALHVYVLPDDDLAERLEEISRRLDGVESLPRMPTAWLHFTVSRLAQFDDLRQAELATLCDLIGEALRGVGPFELDLGAARVEATGVACTVAPSEPWDRLVEAVRGAASAFSDAPLPAAPHAPHVSLAYATGPVEDAEVEVRLAGSSPVGRATVARAHLVSVTVRPELGTFDWTELANWDLEG